MQPCWNAVASLCAFGVFGALGVASLPSPLLAQNAPQTRPIALVISGGAAVPLSGFRDYSDLGVHADVSLLVRVASFAARLRPEFTYSRFGLKPRPIVLLQTAPPASGLGTRMGSASMSSADVVEGYGQGTGSASTLLGLLGNVELPLASGFYLLAGVGATSVTTGATTASGDVSTTGLTYNGGAGLRFHLGAITGFIEGRMKGISLDKGRALFGDVRTVPVSFGLVF